MNKKYKLGNGNILIVHDIDLESNNQIWYEEIGNKTKHRLEYLRRELRAEHISYDEIAELQKNLNLTTSQKQTLQNTIKALDLQIQKLQKTLENSI